MTSLTRSARCALLASLLLGGATRAQAAAPSPEVGGSASAAPSATAKSPEALALLKKMSDRLGAARTFTVKGRASLEGPVAGGLLATSFNDFEATVRRPDGLVATSFNDFEATVRRPDGLVAKRKGDLPEFLFVYDGKTMAVQVPGKGTWGSTGAPATIDDMLVALGEKGDLDLPFDELLVADPYAAVTRGLTDAVRVGQSTVQGKKVEHVVLVTASLRVEYWIDAGTGLPARSLVVYLDHPVQPHFLVEYASWVLDPKLPAATFTLPRPPGATQVDFREAASAFR